MNNIEIGSHNCRIRLESSNGMQESIFYECEYRKSVHSIWKVYVTGAEGEKCLEAGSDCQFSFREIAGGYELKWESTDIQISALVTEVDNRLIWKASAECLSGVYALDRLVFPILGDFHSLSDDAADDYLVLPWQNGLLIRDPIHTLLNSIEERTFWSGRGGLKYENEYPAQFSFQFAAWYSTGHSGSYFAVEDGEAHIKTIGFYYNPSSDTFSFAVTHYPENMGKVCYYAMPYTVVWQSFEGDWQTAAGLYREWGIRQKWCAAGRLSERELPDHVQRPDLWRINHMDYDLGARTEEFFNTSLELRDRLNCNLALHWYGWNRREHDFRYPEYLEPENIAWPTELRNWNRRFSDEGILKIPYVNARLWDVHTRSWTEKNAEQSAIRDREGQIPEEPWNPKTDLRPMCPATSLWQQTVQDFCKQYFKQYGFDGLYIDQIGSYNATLCFDVNHPHPVGGGTWWNDSYHAIVRSVRNAAGRQAVLTTESCCETYVDVFDLFLILEQNLQKHYLFTGGTGCDSIPLFNMIYGDYALSYGSLTRFSDTLPEFEFNFVRNFLWGLIPTVQAVDATQLASPEAEKYLAVLKTVVNFYQENKKLFLYGRLAGVLNLNCPMMELTWQMPDRTYIQTQPVVMATLWEDTMGKRSVFMYNFGSEPFKVEEALDTVVESHMLKRVDL